MKLGLRVSLGLFFLDLSLKFFAVRGDYAVINQGLSFGYNFGSKYLFLILLSIILIWLIYEKIWLVALGGVANLLSRIIWGGVVDYWNFLGLVQNNLADWMIGIGLVVYGVEHFRTTRIPCLRRQGIPIVRFSEVQYSRGYSSYI